MWKNDKDNNGKGYVSSSIGLITYDEAAYAGGYYGLDNDNNYLCNGLINFWTMSTAGFSGYVADEWLLSSTGRIYNYNVSITAQLRPVINLKADTYVTGSGISSNPYVVINTYTEQLLNGTDPVLSDNLVPVEIGDDG